MYLSYTHGSSIIREKYDLATDVAMSATGDDIYNFGSSATPILGYLKDTPNQWMCAGSGLHGVA